MAQNAAPAGTKKWRQIFDSTGKLGTNIGFTGDEAKAIIEFMEAEDVANPAGAIRMLVAAALSGYPEWAATAAARKNVMIQQRAIIQARVAGDLQALVAEMEAGIMEEYAQLEAEAIERAVLGDNT